MMDQYGFMGLLATCLGCLGTLDSRYSLEHLCIAVWTAIQMSTESTTIQLIKLINGMDFGSKLSTHSLCRSSPILVSLGILGILGCLGASWHHCFSLVTSWHPTWQPWQWEPVGWSHLQKKTEEFTDFSELIETSTEGPLSLKRNSTGFNMIKPSTWWDSMGFYGGFYGDIRWSLFTLQASAKSLDTWRPQSLGSFKAEIRMVSTRFLPHLMWETQKSPPPSQ